MGFVGIAIATSVSAWISVALLHLGLEKNNYFKITNKIVVPIIIIFLVSFLMYLYLNFLMKYVSVISSFFYYNEIIFLVFSVISSILLYLIIISFYKPFKYSELKKILKK
jgi:peptidoglycan biosynthesis protein MviN/MurJ (putative lipid II flippase)